MTPLRALIWVAVSSRPQLATDSPRQQLRAARALCKARGWPVVGVLRVPGHSRDYDLYEDAARAVPAYRKLYELCQAAPRPFDVLVCRDYDRLGRTIALAATVRAVVERAGARIVTLSAPADPDFGAYSQSGRILSSIAMLQSEMEQTERRRRHADGMAGKFRAGYQPQKPPFGYRRVERLKIHEARDCEPLDGKRPKDIVVYEPEASVVRYIYEQYVAGRPVRSIIGALAGQRAPSERWYYSAIAAVLRNPVYAGYVYYRRKQGGQIQRTPEMIKQGRHTPIVAPAMWQQAQDLMDRKARMGGRAAGSSYLFTGVLHCARCGRRMAVHRTKHEAGVWVSYICNGSQHASSQTCDNARMISQRIVRGWVVAALQRLAESEEMYEAWRRGVAQGDRAEEDRAGIREAIAEKERGIAFWDRQAEAGRVTELEWLDARRRLAGERDALQARLVALADAADRADAIPERAAWLTLLADIDNDALRAVLLAHVACLTWDGTELAMELR